MKTIKNKLVFGKSSITELNDQQSLRINGGTDTAGETTDGIDTTCSILITDPKTDQGSVIVQN